MKKDKKIIPPFDEEIEITVDRRMPQKWNIITALDWLLEEARDSELNDHFWNVSKEPIKYLTRRLKLNKIQVVLLAILIENADSMSWRQIGEFLGCSRISMMVYSEDLDEMVAKRWVVRRGSRERGTMYEGFQVAQGVVKAMRKNKCFVPEKIDGLNEQEFIDRLELRLEHDLFDRFVDFGDTEEWMEMMCKANPQLPLCQRALKYNDYHVMALLLLMVFDYAQWADSDNEGIVIETLEMFPEDFECDGLRRSLKNGEHVLQRQGFFEFACEDGVANTERIKLTSKSKKEFLSAYTPSRSKVPKRQKENRYLTSHTDITEKQMFYNEEEQKQIDRLTQLLTKDNLSVIQKRLQEQGMRKGVACLFHGGPGTGKTETVLQVARATGRDIMQVEIAGLRDKFVGESEKNIKAIFATYRQLCETSEVTPILFFNEADAIINKRTTNIDSPVSKMDNAIQNIILQELETLDGILIATTNLTANMDSAFERRFLFKIEFNKPQTDVKAKIWSSMLKNISDSDAYTLASKFDFSGGQIENIARKRAIEYVLTGVFADLKGIESYCENELIDDSQPTARPHVGFAV